MTKISHDSSAGDQMSLAVCPPCGRVQFPAVGSISRDVSLVGHILPMAEREKTKADKHYEQTSCKMAEGISWRNVVQPNRVIQKHIPLPAEL